MKFEANYRFKQLLMSVARIIGDKCILKDKIKEGLKQQLELIF